MHPTHCRQARDQAALGSKEALLAAIQESQAEALAASASVKEEVLRQTAADLEALRAALQEEQQRQKEEEEVG
jgi:hypothetical protein